MIIKSPGISPSTPLLEVAKRLKIKVTGCLELYYLLDKKSPIIGVTGSNGKTTVTTLINKIINTKYHYLVGGNIGIGLLDLIDKQKEGSIIECSSFMLDTTNKFKPHIFVILNIDNHHLDYHGSYTNYFNAKTKCLKNMTNEDFVIYNYDNELLRKCVNKCKAQKISFSKNNEKADAYIKNNMIIFKGISTFNLCEASSKNPIIHLDYLPAFIVGKIYNIENQFINNIFKTYLPLEHRCEIIYQKKNLVIINDSKATSPTATFTAFEFINTQFSSFQPLWIAGGKKTSDDFQVLNQIKQSGVDVYLYGENKEEIFNILNKNKFNIQIFPNLEEIIEKINLTNDNQNIILFSPSSPSLDMFESFEERGNSFKELIQNKLKKNKEW